jgi:hypothetical protein
MAERTITIRGLSKTYSITEWRLAYAIACDRLTAAIGKVHDFLTVGVPHPLQEAGRPRCACRSRSMPSWRRCMSASARGCSRRSPGRG